MKETAESIKKEIEKVNIKLVEMMAKNTHYKTSEEYKELRTKRLELVKKLGRLIRKVEYVEELEVRNRGVKL